MLKIIELHASTNPQSEYIVLENQGLNTINLKGYALCTDAYFTGDTQRLTDEIFIFQEDAFIKPFTRVVLLTGVGEGGWFPTIDGKRAYCLFWNRRASMWSQHSDVHLLHIAGSRRVVPESISMSA